MIEKKHLADVVILKPHGAIMGGPETTEFQTTLDELLAEGLSKIVVDLKDVRWINAAGIGILVESLNRLREIKGDLKLARCCGKTGWILSILKMENIFPPYDTLDNAVGSFA